MALHVYGNKKKVPGPFEHSGMTILIFEMDKGGVHCKKQHDYRSRNCGTCKADIASRRIFMGFVDGKQSTKDCDSLEEALRVSKIYIDARFEDDDDENDDSSSGPDAMGSADNHDHAMEVIDQLGWVKHAMALIKQDEEAAAEADTLPPPKR